MGRRGITIDVMNVQSVGLQADDDRTVGMEIDPSGDALMRFAMAWALG